LLHCENKCVLKSAFAGSRWVKKGSQSEHCTRTPWGHIGGWKQKMVKPITADKKT